MKKNRFKFKKASPARLNCRMGRYYVLPGQDIYGRNASAVVRKSFPSIPDNTLAAERFEKPEALALIVNE